MTHLLLSLRVATLLAVGSSVSSCVIFGGVSGPVYATDTDLVLKRAEVPYPANAPANDTTFVLAAGQKYRIVDVVAGTNYIKMTGKTKYRTGASVTKIVPLTKEERKSVKDSPAITGYHILLNTNRNHELFTAQEKDIKPYQRVLTTQVAVGTMILPIKIRGPIDFNGTHYERQFSTDISIGPYIGYRFKVSGNDYKPFTTVGLFAGPTLINYVSATTQSGSPTPASTTPDNMFAFTYGLGIVHEINGFQIGLVYGTDRVSGKRVVEWPYDGKGWFSLGIGYNFLAAR